MAVCGAQIAPKTRETYVYPQTCLFLWLFEKDHAALAPAFKTLLAALLQEHPLDTRGLPGVAIEAPTA